MAASIVSGREPSAPFRVVVVDDEPLARQVLRVLVGGTGDFEVVAECRDGNEALVVLTEVTPDLIFLDVRMPDLDGVELVRAVGSLGLDPPPAIVFVTAYDEFAVRAFEVDAIDYLVKPFTDDRFHATMARVRRHLERERTLAQPNEPTPGESAVQSRLVVTVGDRSVVVHAASIDWVRADGYYSRLHVGRTSYLIRCSLGALAKRLGTDRFVRAHRNVLVQIDRVVEMRRGAGRRCELVLTTGARIPVSERRRADLTRTLGGGR